ncbi:unnamed protein product [Bursaphelenchus xylophilus]|uniref:(pine wood nematode) hypothetical protein n=1 Tax=Bursaphelenchus xylophilus TaxID=6326 RepID=A0A1I7S4K1_BURXY|nr:unnamed protein product [Bursaphelenchus xylophilus]CAG9117186.1 unnamed protein product [Bursaphelenchus xylophilus]
MDIIQASFLKDILLYTELCVSVVSSLFNAYVTYRSAFSSCIHPSLRLILSTTMGSLVIISLTHPFSNLVPSEYYSIEKGHYKNAIIFYSVMLTSHYAYFVFTIKYFLITLERRAAIGHIRAYEMSGPWFGRKILKRSAIFCLFVLLLNMATRYWVFRNSSVDVILRTVIVPDKWIPGYLFAYMEAFVGMIFAVVLMRDIEKKLQVKCFCTPLSRKYEMRQTVAIMNYLNRILQAFAALLVAIFPMFSVLTYLYFKLNHSSESLVIIILFTTIHITVQFYNIITAYYMYAEFPQVRQLIAKDICFKQRAAVLPSISGTVEDVEIHFGSLYKMWK